MDKRLQDFNLNGTNLVQLVWNHRKLIIIIGIVAFVSSLVVSFIITPHYKVTAVLIPSAASQASKDVLVNSRVKGITVFAEDQELEHLLQVLSSETLRKDIVTRLNLFSNYGVDPNYKHAWYEVNRIFSSNISFSPTKYRSVKIEVLDPSPQMATRIAQTIIVVADSLMRSAKRDVARKALSVLERHYEVALAESKVMDDSLTMVMSRGVIDLPLQTKELTKGYASALLSGNDIAAKKIERTMANLAKDGAAFTRLKNDIQNKSIQISKIVDNLHILQVEAAGEIPSQFVIDSGITPDKKSYPKKMIIVIVSTLAAVFFSVFLLLLVDFFRKSIDPVGEA